MTITIMNLSLNLLVAMAVFTATVTDAYSREAYGVRGRGGATALPVRRGKAALSSGCKSHPAIAPAGSNRSSHGGDEMAEAFG